LPSGETSRMVSAFCKTRLISMPSNSASTNIIGLFSILFRPRNAVWLFSEHLLERKAQVSATVEKVNGGEMYTFVFKDDSDQWPAKVEIRADSEGQEYTMNIVGHKRTGNYRRALDEVEGFVNRIKPKEEPARKGPFSGL